MEITYDVVGDEDESAQVHASSFRISESGALVFADEDGREFGAIHSKDWRQVWTEDLSKTQTGM